MSMRIRCRIYSSNLDLKLIIFSINLLFFSASTHEWRTPFLHLFLAYKGESREVWWCHRQRSNSTANIRWWSMRWSGSSVWNVLKVHVATAWTEHPCCWSFFNMLVPSSLRCYLLLWLLWCDVMLLLNVSKY